MDSITKENQILDSFAIVEKSPKDQWYQPIYTKYLGLIGIIGQEKADEWRINELKIHFKIDKCG